MDFLKRHLDTLIIVGSVCGACIWMNGKFNDVDRRLIRIETVMIMKGIMPEIFAHEYEE